MALQHWVICKRILCKDFPKFLFLFFQPLGKKLDNGIRVPFIYAQSLHNVSLVIQQLDERVRASHVPHFQAGKFERIISLHKCYNSNTQRSIMYHTAHSVACMESFAYQYLASSTETMHKISNKLLSLNFCLYLITDSQARGVFRNVKKRGPGVPTTDILH